MTEQYKTIEEVREALAQKRNLLAEKQIELIRLREQKSTVGAESKKEIFMKIIQNYLTLQEQYTQIMNQIKELDESEKAEESTAKLATEPRPETENEEAKTQEEGSIPKPSTEQKKNPAGLNDIELEKFLRLAKRVSKGVKAEIKNAEKKGTNVFEAAKRELEKLDAPGNAENYYKYILKQAKSAEKDEDIDGNEHEENRENPKIKLEPEDIESMTPETQAMIELLGQENIEAGMNQVAEQESNAPENLPVMPESGKKEIVPITKWLKIPIGSIVETEEAESTSEGIQPSPDKTIVAEVEYVGGDYVSLKSEQGVSFRRYVDLSKNFHIYMINRAPEKKEEEKEIPLEPTVEIKQADIEIINSKELKIEVDKIIKENFKTQIEEKGLKYLGVDISTIPEGIKLQASFKGGFMVGEPKFVVEIKTTDGKMLALNPDFKANKLVKAFVSQEQIQEMTNSLGQNVKTFIEKSRGKEINRIDIENGNLKIEYK